MTPKGRLLLTHVGVCRCDSYNHCELCLQRNMDLCPKFDEIRVSSVARTYGFSRKDVADQNKWSRQQSVETLRKEVERLTIEIVSFDARTAELNDHYEMESIKFAIAYDKWRSEEELRQHHVKIRFREMIDSIKQDHMREMMDLHIDFEAEKKDLH